MIKLNIQATLKCGIIYRNGPKEFTFDCAYCDQMMDINDISDHIEAHFSSTNDQIIIPPPTEEIFLEEQIQIKAETEEYLIKFEPDDNQKIDSCQLPTLIPAEAVSEPVPTNVSTKPETKSENLNINKITKKKRTHTKLYKPLKFKQFNCDICGVVVSSRPNMKDHMEIHINIDKYKCSICEKMFSTRHRLRDHQANHQLIPCPFCEKVLMKLSFANHIRTHTTVRPYKCDFCEKGFVQLKYLKSHMVIHTGETKYKCDQCDAAFKRKGELRTHMCRCHDVESPHKCDVCGKVFIDNSTLRVHKRVHTGEKPFSCEVCELAFANKSTLVGHRLTHIEERRFKCKYCEESFVQRPAKYCHERRMHKIQRNQEDKKSI